MTHLLLVGAGGFLGALARYGLSYVVAQSAGTRFPYGTLTINVLGCLAIGLLMPVGGERGGLGEGGRLFWVVGLLGGFTTFSAFGHETASLFRAGRSGAALVYMGASLLLGVAAVGAGRFLVSMFAKT